MLHTPSPHVRRIAGAVALAIVALLTVLACLGCGDDDDEEVALPGGALPSATLETNATVPVVEACTPTHAIVAAGDSTQTITSGGVERSYSRRVPPQYDGLHALPVVLNFHGYGSNATQQARYSRFPAKADQAGFVLVTPDATGSPQAWNNLVLAERTDDVGFVRDLIDQLAQELCVDQSRVFAAGMSNGAAFSVRLACAMPERLRAVAAVTAMVYPLNCPSETPTPVVGFHGTEDMCVPFEGGQTQCGAARLPVLAMPEYVRRWAEHNGCAPEPTESSIAEHVRRIAYGECEAAADVHLYVIEGGGHTWPGSFGPVRLGESTREIDATDLIWEFFAAH